MKARELFSKTMPFAWTKLLLGLANVLISAVLFGIFAGLAWLFRSESVTGIMILIWLGSVGVIRFIIMHYVGYMVNAGHIAVMTEAVTKGTVPVNQVAYGKQMVTERFATSNIFFAVDKLISGAVKQIQNGIDKVGDVLNFIPGMDSVAGLAKFFVELSLGYVDECCLGYTFYKKEQGAFKSAADAVVIYAQNWKALLSSAAKTMVMVVIALAGITLGLFVALGLLFRTFAWPGWIAFAISFFVAMAIKYAFIDSFILARTMVAYMTVAPSAVITFDLYNKLCNLSSKFKELFNKGQQENAIPQPAFAGVGNYAQSTPNYTQTPSTVQASEQEEKPIFCAQCGAKNKRDVKFCLNCGKPMQ